MRSINRYLCSLVLLVSNHWIATSQAEPNGWSWWRQLKGAEALGLGLRTQEEYEISLDPFQLKLQYDNNSSLLTTEDEIMILETAQSFVTDQLAEVLPSFLRLAFFQYVRDFSETEERFSKVAWGGFAFFNEANMDRKFVQTEIYLSFLDDSKFDFLSDLHMAGLDSVVDVTLMSIDGTELEYRDGKILPVKNPPTPSATEETTSTATTTTTTTSEDDASSNVDSTRTIARSSREAMGGDGVWKKTILLSLFIPIVVLCMSCSVYAYRSVKEINWEDNWNEDASIWHSTNYHNTTGTKRRRVEKKDSQTITVVSETQRRISEEEEVEEVEGKEEEVLGENEIEDV